MPFLTADRRLLLAGALAAGGLALSAGQADAAYTPALQDRTLVVTGDAASDKLALRLAPSKLPTLALDVGDDGSADFQIALSRFDTIRVLAGDGADTVTVADVSGVQEVDADLGTDTATDRLVLNGTAAGELVQVKGSPGSTLVSGLPAIVSAAHADELAISTQAGDDRIEPSGTGLPKLVEDGGAGNDTLIGSDAADELAGGDGNDFLSAEGGDDATRGGAGDDVVHWATGDGSDTLEGDAGSDAITMNGNSSSEQFRASSVGQRLRVTRTQSNVSDILDGGGIERLSVFSFGGADTMRFDDLAPAGVTAVDASMFDFGTAGDDVFIVNGTAGADRVNALPKFSSTGTTQVTGLATAFTISGFSIADRLELNGLAGDDVIGTSVPPATVQFRSDGGAGDDTLVGGEGDDVLIGGDGADLVFAAGGDDVGLGGAGDDLLRGDGGDDFLDGSAGKDTLIGGAGADVLLNGETLFQD